MTAKVRTIRITIAPTSRTDLMCGACGGFRSDFAILANDDADDADLDTLAVFGVHKKCLPALKAQPKPRKKV